MAKTGTSGSRSSSSKGNLSKELSKRAKLAQKLVKKRDRLLTQVDALNKKIAENGGSPGGGRARLGGGVRPKNSMTLYEALVTSMKGKTMSVSEAAEAIKKAGYKTNAENFRVMVNQTFIKYPNKFKKVRHGHYSGT